LSGWKEVLADEIGHSGVAANLLELLRSLMPAIEIQGEKQSSLGRLSRLQDALKLLHVAEKTTELTDQLMLPTLGSQEGAFENVRMSYSGDQGQSIRQLVTTHMIRRVVMCCLSSGGSVEAGRLLSEEVDTDAFVLCSGSIYRPLCRFKPL